MDYRDEVSKIASDVFYAWGGDIDERHINEIDARVDDYISGPLDLSRVLNESASADVVEPVNHGSGYKHGLALEAMKRDICEEIEQMARDAIDFA